MMSQDKIKKEKEAYEKDLKKQEEQTFKEIEEKEGFGAMMFLICILGFIIGYTLSNYF